MSRPVAVFWGSALAVAVGVAVLAAIFLPYEALRLDTVAERERAWLLTVWTAGVLAVLFGLSSVLGASLGIGVREVVEAGSFGEAAETHRRNIRRWGEEEFHRSFDWWLVMTGLLLVLIYFAGWFALR